MFPEQVRALDYLARKGSQAPVATLREQMRHAFSSIEDLLTQIPPPQREARPSPDRWGPIEILDHLVISHGPAIPQLRALLAGSTPGGVAIPAGLQTPTGQRGSWEQLLADLRGIHRELLALADGAEDGLSLEPKSVVEMVVKVEGRPVHWHTEMDWKAFVQAIRVHTLEHRGQLERALAASAKIQP